MGESLYNIFGQFDLSRAPSKALLSTEKGRKAIMEEIRGLATEGRDKRPSAKLILLNGTMFPKLPRLCSTAVLKVEPDATMKARMCVRGNMQSLAHCPFRRAPTSDREFIGIMLMMINTPSWSLSVADVDRASEKSE